MTTPPRMVSYFSPEVMVSVRVPLDWTGQVLGDVQFRIFGPHEPDFDDYRSTMSFQRTGIIGEGQEWFEDFVAGADANLARENHEFRRLGEDRFVLSSGALVHTTWFSWTHEETDLHFVQLQALILAQDRRLIIVNAATLEPLSETYRPIFDEVLRSTRLIPGDPPSAREEVPSMMEIVKKYLDDDDWEYSRAEDGDTLTTTYQGEHGHWTCVMEVREEERQLLFYSMCPERAPVDRLDEITDLIMRANHDLAIGSFDLDADDGTIRFRTSVDVMGDRLSEALVRNVVMANVTLMDLYLPDIRSIIGRGS